MSDPVAGAEPANEEGGFPRAAVWQPTLQRVRRALADKDDAALIALEDEVSSLLERPRRALRGAVPQLLLYESLITWTKDGRFEPPYTDAQTAKIQFWDLVEHSSDLEYKKHFANGAVERYPERRGFRLFQRVLANVTNSTSTFKDGPEDVQVYRRPGATMTIIGFGAMKGGFAGMGWDLFERAVVEPLNANFIVLKDLNTRIYLAGIQSLGDYATSVAKMREIVSEFNDTRIVATGASAGVFGAINFSADLGVRHVVAFAGPTSIEVGENNSERQIYRRISADLEAGRFERVDLAKKVNESAIERIEFFVSGKLEFDMAQMLALSERSAKVKPHVYEHLNDHIVTDYAIEDGSLFEAFRAGPDTPGLAGG